MYALIDPRWGDPAAVTTTIADTYERSKWLTERCAEVSLYSGYSEYPLPKGTPGNYERLKDQGFRIREIEITIKGVDDE